jgi:methyl-accepting chemotaxis protein
MKKSISISIFSMLSVLFHSVWAGNIYNEKDLQAYAQKPEVVAVFKDFSSAFGTVRAENKMDSIDEAKKAVFEFYDGTFSTEYKESNGKSPDLNAAKNLDEDAIALQYYYIVKNAEPMGQKNHLIQATDASTWTKFHAKHHSATEKYTHDESGLYDLFLVDLEGRIVYSVFKEIDFATRLIGGPYEKTELGAVFKAVKESGDKNFVKTSKKAPYFPSFDGETQFMGTGIYEGDTKIGILIIQLPVW